MKKVIFVILALTFLAVPSGRAQSMKITKAELSQDFQALSVRIQNSELSKADRDTYAGLMGYLSRTIEFKSPERKGH